VSMSDKLKNKTYRAKGERFLLPMKTTDPTRTKLLDGPHPSELSVATSERLSLAQNEARLITNSTKPLPISVPFGLSQHHLLKEVSLHTEPSHNALPYIWNTTQGRPILCDGRHLLVTPNCEDALRHLRLKFKSRVLWIDAGCIDQASIPDGSLRVPLMAVIHHPAHKSIALLGPGEPVIQAPFNVPTLPARS
jgi:Heterokaryon incompatibility protein (HET)